MNARITALAERPAPKPGRLVSIAPWIPGAHLHLVLDHAGDPARERPADIRLNGSAGGRPVHVQVTAEDLRAGADEAADLLLRSLGDLKDRHLTQRRNRSRRAAVGAQAAGTSLDRLA